MENYNGSSSPTSTEQEQGLTSTSYVESALTGPTYDYQVIESLDIADIATLLPQIDEDLTPSLSVAQAMAQMLEELGVQSAFGVAGGALANLWGALSNSTIEVMNFRHEAGAAFAAVEAYFASDRPTVIFTTAGPGIVNALTGLFAARGEGAKVIFLSACTSAPQRGKWAIQETSDYTLPMGGIFTSGALFNYATTVECAGQLPQIFRRLALGLAQPGGFVAHLTVPTVVQTSLMDDIKLPQLDVSDYQIQPSNAALAKCVELLTEGPFAIWVGFGARNAAAEILKLAEMTGAAVMCSPRAKGIFPEDHPQFVGVTGLGGHTSVMTYMQSTPPLRTLVLGTRLGEPTSFWNQTLVPSGGFVHVDIDPDVPGVSYPTADTFAVQSDIGVFVRELLKHIGEEHYTKTSLPNPQIEALAPTTNSGIRPEVLMAEIQRVIVEGSDAVVMAECGNSFTWSTHLLRFAQANRYRVSTGVGAMGHAATGVLGAALARNTKAVAIVGDGAMLMNNEINSAVKYQIPGVWIILNDARYNMCHQGMEMLGLQGADATMPETDFVMISRGMGGDGIRVLNESEIPQALEQAMLSTKPFVVDVLIDPTRKAPSKGRNQGLASQGVKSNGSKPPMLSFPNI